MECMSQARTRCQSRDRHDGHNIPQGTHQEVSLRLLHLNLLGLTRNDPVDNPKKQEIDIKTQWKTA